MTAVRHATIDERTFSCSACGTLLGTIQPPTEEMDLRTIHLKSPPRVRVPDAERDGFPAFGIRRGARLHGRPAVRGADPGKTMLNAARRMESPAVGETTTDYIRASLPECFDTWCLNCGARMRFDVATDSTLT